VLVVRGNERLRPGQAVTVEGALCGKPPSPPTDPVDPG
jgi:hypothetical protein